MVELTDKNTDQIKFKAYKPFTGFFLLLYKTVFIKKYVLFVALAWFTLNLDAQIGIQTNSPDASSALDIVSTTKGLLIPRVTLTTDLTSPLPVTAPATGLLVFNTGANQAQGLYYWSGTQWNLFSAGGASGDFWSITGNVGIDPSNNFIGTIDSKDVHFRRSNLMAGILTQSGLTTFGVMAGAKSKTSSKSTYFGFEAGFLETDGKENAFVGYYAGNKTTTGDKNVALGHKSLDNNSTGHQNTSIGAESGMTSGNFSNSTAIGYKAMATASNQVRLGDEHVESLFCEGAYFATSSDAPNLVVDNNGQIMRSTAGGGGSGDPWYTDGNSGLSDGNSFLGTTDNIPLNFRINNVKSGRLTDDGTTFLGYQAGFNSSAAENTAIGSKSLYSMTSGKHNSALGFMAGYSVTSGFYNVAIGYQSLNVTRSGSNNVAIGHGAGNDGDSYHNAISIGWGATATNSDQVRIGSDDIEEMFCMGAYTATSSNPANMYVDANGQIMRSTASGSGADFWNLEGNSGTTVGTNFMGTTDLEDLAFKTNNAERMRVTEDGQLLVGLTTAYNASDLVTIEGNATQNYALNVLSPLVGIYSSAQYGIYAVGTSRGILAAVNGSSAFGGWLDNNDANGWGAIATGSARAGSILAGHSAGLSAIGDDGIWASAKSSTGTGIIAGGSNVSTYSTITTGSGGAFTGNDGLYGKAVGISGTGVLGVGNNGAAYQYLTVGSGGSFVGYHGLYGKGTYSTGIGVVGVGNNGGTYHTISQGSGGAFTGYHGVYGVGVDEDDGVGVIGIGNNGSTIYNITNGAGGAFTGYNGSISTATNSSGTGVVGVGNNVLTAYTLGGGSGGAFTGNVCGVYGYATNTSGDRYGGYFAVGGGRYAYVGGRYGGTNRKIVGNGTVSTIVENTKGENVTLVCPEAPESLFQDYGIGQLTNGRVRIEIDPDLAININVSEDHPLKVFVTLEGDCNGVYVTNKSARGFDVVELQGGNSNVPFSWQIVATRANEEYTLKDGSTEISDYSHRFQAAPPPLEDFNNKSMATSITKSQRISQQAITVNSVESKEEPVEEHTIRK